MRALKKPSSYSQLLYQFDEVMWPEFKQFNGAVDAFESLSKGIYDHIETLGQYFQLRGCGKGDEILFMRAEEPCWAIRAFGLMKSDHASPRISHEYEMHNPARASGAQKLFQ